MISSSYRKEKRQSSIRLGNSLQKYLIYCENVKSLSKIMTSQLEHRKSIVKEISNNIRWNINNQLHSLFITFSTGGP